MTTRKSKYEKLYSALFYAYYGCIEKVVEYCYELRKDASMPEYIVEAARKATKESMGEAFQTLYEATKNLVKETKGNTFKVSDFTYNFKEGEKRYKFLKGICHDKENKVAVATNKFACIVSKKDFREDLPTNASIWISKKKKRPCGLYLPSKIDSTFDGEFNFPDWKPLYEAFKKQGKPLTMPDKEELREAFRLNEVCGKASIFAISGIKLDKELIILTENFHMVLTAPDWNKFYHISNFKGMNVDALAYEDKNYFAIWIGTESNPTNKLRKSKFNDLLYHDCMF